jgi:hypothetical protein
MRLVGHWCIEVTESQFRVKRELGVGSYGSLGKSRFEGTANDRSRRNGEKLMTQVKFEFPTEWTVCVDGSQEDWEDPRVEKNASDQEPKTQEPKTPEPRVKSRVFTAAASGRTSA